MQILKPIIITLLLTLLLNANEQKSNQQEEKIPLSIGKKFDSTKLHEYPNTIFISSTKQAKEIKKEFLKKGSKYYSIAIATLPMKKGALERFYRKNGIEDSSLAHVYGKKRDKIRVIYGLYITPTEAREAILNLNKNLKSNRPFFMKMDKFQGFYQNSLAKEDIVKLKIKDKKKDKIISPSKLSTNLKILKPSTKKVDKKSFEKEKKIEKKVVKAEEKQKTLKKNTNSFLKKSRYEDIYYVEENGEINLLKESFLDEKASFYTVILDDIRLSQTSIKEYYIKHDITNNSLAYIYGDAKTHAKIIFGAYESEKEAKEASLELKNYLGNETKVSSIKKHQLLYKKFHHKINKNLSVELLYLYKDAPYNIKDEFLKNRSGKYTIQLATIKKSREDLDRFIVNNSIEQNLLIYELKKGYYKIFYGVFDSLKEAKDKIENLNSILKANRPFISKIDTIRNRFEYYNHLSKEDYFKTIEKIN